MLALVQGEIDMMFNNFIVSLPLIKTNRLRALAITSPERSSIAPGLPTMDEAGLRGFEMQQFYMVVAPAGTSREIVNRLNAEIARTWSSIRRGGAEPVCFSLHACAESMQPTQGSRRICALRHLAARRGQVRR